MISVPFQGKPFNITVIQVYAPTSNAEEAEVERFYEDLQELLELTPKKYVLFIIGDWNAKVGSQETPGITGKFGLGVQNEVGQRLIEFCQENKTEIDVFLELSCFFHDPANVGNLISSSSDFSKSSWNIWKIKIHILLKPGLENFEHYFTSV